MPLSPAHMLTPQAAEFTRFPSRRSVVHSTKGIVSCTQPLAAKCGLEVLHAGGNAADAAVAVAAGLNMTEPCSTGIGGDMFILYYDAKTAKVSAMNGSGRSGNKCTLETVRRDLGLADGAQGKIPSKSVHAVTVPGAAAGWVDTVERFGSGNLALDRILAPAIELGERGFPVSDITGYYWTSAESILREASPNYGEMLKKDPSAKDGVRAPRPGEIMKNPDLARTFRALATEGKKGFYQGRIAEEYVKVCRDLGGHIDLDDLAHHLETGSEPVEPISLKLQHGGFHDDGVEVWEHPPNGQGIVALMALGILQALQNEGTIPKWKPEDHNTAPYLHAIIEALRLGFTDAQWYVTDPNVEKRGTPPTIPSPALHSSDTVYFAVSDGDGNAASLDAGHPNRLAPRKRPYHTIIPGMVTNLADGSLHSAFGVMGGFMQPQGHVQVLLGQLVGGLNPQQALDAPRVCIDFDWNVNVEEGMPADTIEGLRKLGHKVRVLTGNERGLFGRGQIIRHTVDPLEDTGIWSAGSDMRGDGASYPAW
ncbi:Dicarboxylic amino acid permease [Verticillium dahliae VDG1]|nr:Dicarboxylic amino acid permease [Verticillium dahliae VDG1]